MGQVVGQVKPHRAFTAAARTLAHTATAAEAPAVSDDSDDESITNARYKIPHLRAPRRSVAKWKIQHFHATAFVYFLLRIRHHMFHGMVVVLC